MMTKIASKLAILLGNPISIGISEPWEFEDEVGSSKFKGTITDVYVFTHLRKSSEKEIEFVIVHVSRPFAYAKLIVRFTKFVGESIYQQYKL